MVKTSQKTNARGLERLCTTLVSIHELITSRSSLLNSPNKQKPEDAVRCIAYLGVITLQVTTQSLNRQASTTIDRGRSSLKISRLFAAWFESSSTWTLNSSIFFKRQHVNTFMQCTRILFFSWDKPAMQPRSLHMRAGNSKGRFVDRTPYYST